jgi:hypothetical protein
MCVCVESCENMLGQSSLPPPPPGLQLPNTPLPFHAPGPSQRALAAQGGEGRYIGSQLQGCALTSGLLALLLTAVNFSGNALVFGMASLLASTMALLLGTVSRVQSGGCFPRHQRKVA